MRALGRAVAFALLLAAGLAAAETPIPPPPEHWVTDRAQLLSAATVADLDARLAAYSQQSGHQLLVYIDRTTGGVPIEDWAARAFQSWKVGRRGIDDGLVLFVFSQDRRSRIEVGYGLEARVPDALAGRILAERLAPRLRAGDADGGVRAVVDALMQAAGGAGGAGGAPSPHVSIWALLGGALLLLLLVGFAVTHPALAAMMLFEISSRRSGGGGGSSGGGGASGSW